MVTIETQILRASEKPRIEKHFRATPANDGMMTAAHRPIPARDKATCVNELLREKKNTAAPRHRVVMGTTNAAPNLSTKSPQKTCEKPNAIK